MLGYRPRQSCGYLLGCRVLGAVCYHHGGERDEMTQQRRCLTPLQFLKEREHEVTPEQEAVQRQWSRRPSHSRTRSTPGRTIAITEHDPLLRRRRSFEEHHAIDTAEMEQSAGGTILGIHNLAIVFPQFIVSFPAYTNGQDSLN